MYLMDLSNCILTINKKISIIVYVKGEKDMVAKLWKKVLFVILIIACLFNIVNKLVHKASLKEELQSSADYIQEQKIEQGK